MNTELELSGGYLQRLLEIRNARHIVDPSGQTPVKATKDRIKTKNGKPVAGKPDAVKPIKL